MMTYVDDLSTLTTDLAKCSDELERVREERDVEREIKLKMGFLYQEEEIKNKKLTKAIEGAVELLKQSGALNPKVSYWVNRLPKYPPSLPNFGKVIEAADHLSSVVSHKQD
jgi:hypothetical protein